MTFKPEYYIKNDQKVKALNAKNIAITEIQAKQKKEMGIIDKEGKHDIVASKFIKYCMKRIAVHQKGEEFWFYNFHEKQYDQLSDSRIRKIFFEIICEADDSIWNASMEKKYIDFFRRYVREFEVTGYEPGILQFQNGILDFSGEELLFEDASPDYFCQFRLPYNYDKNAECPQFLKFLNDIFENDQERIELIQEIMGASLLYDDCMQNLVVFLGKGSNGKSLLATMIKHMLGKSNVSAISIDRLSGDRFSKQNLDNKMLNISSETNVNKLYSTADIKSLTGGDSVEVEKKFSDAYTTEIHSKFILLANEMIKTSDKTDGFYRRLIIIPFNKQYHDHVPGTKKEKGKAYKDIYLESKLYDELSGIFNFALNGLRRLQENDYHFTQPQVCNEASERYIAEQNIIKAFVRKHIIFTGNNKDRINKPALFNEFQKYCEDGHFYKHNRQTTREKFKNLLVDYADCEDLFIKIVKSQGKYYYCGLKHK